MVGECQRRTPPFARVMALSIAVVFAAFCLLAAHRAEAYPQYLGACQTDIGNSHMGQTVRDVGTGTDECKLTIPSEYIPGESYSISVQKFSRRRFLASTSDGTLSGASSKSGCSSMAVYGTGSSFTFNAPSSGSGTVTLTTTCGSQSGLAQTSITITEAVAVECNTSPSVAHGTACSSADTFNPSCDVMCDTGYEVTSNTLTCTDNGTFSGSATCSPVSCTSPPTVDHGSTCSMATYESPSCTVTCDMGYNLDSNTLMCTSDGSFSGSASCSPESCTPPSVENGMTCDTLVYDGTCDVDCDSGYELTANTIFCTHEGVTEGSATCSNIDACETFASECSANSEGCMDIEGGPNSAEGITCGSCNAGYEGDGFTCTEIDSCDPNPCGSNSVCTDLDPPMDGFECGCMEGYFTSTDAMDNFLCEECTQCADNEYATGTCVSSDYTSCEDCPTNAESTAGSNEGIDSCECVTGFFKDTSMGGDFVCTMEECDEGEWATMGACETCAPLICPAGEMLTGMCEGNTNTLACEACPSTSVRAGEGTTCSVCADGTTASSDRTQCEACSSDSAGTGGNCDTCVANSSPNNDKTACVCNANAIINGDACDVCADGTMPNDDQTACEACPANHAGSDGACSQCSDGEEPNMDSSACVACQPLEAGTGGECTACGVGMVPNMEATACVSCDATDFRGAADDDCATCPDGEEPNANQSACVACSGRTAGSGGMCSECESNQVPNSDRSGCDDCPFDVSEDGLLCVNPMCGSMTDTGDVCTPCDGCDCPLTHVESDDDCEKCPEGQAAVDGNCEMCPSNRILAGGRCRQCPPGSGVASDECMPCTMTQYSNDSLCVACPAEKVPNIHHTACEDVEVVNIYLGVEYTTLQANAMLQMMLRETIMAEYERVGILVLEVAFSSSAGGLTRATVKTAPSQSSSITNLAARGDIELLVGGNMYMVGDSVSSSGDVVQSSASTSSGGSGTGGQSASTTTASTLSAASIAAAFVITFILVFVVFGFALKMNVKRRVLMGYGGGDLPRKESNLALTESYHSDL